MSECTYCHGQKTLEFQRRAEDPITVEPCPMCDGRFDAANEFRHSLIHRKFSAGLSGPETLALAVLQNLVNHYCPGATPAMWKRMAEQKAALEAIDRELDAMDRMLNKRC